MNLGRAFYIAVFVLMITILTRGCSMVSFAQTFMSTPWRYVNETNVWIRHFSRQGETAILTLERRRESKLRYGVALTCPATKQRLIFTWEHGETYGKSREGCGDKPLTIIAEDWEEAFEPIPEEIRPRPAEIFINPENPQIVA